MHVRQLLRSLLVVLISVQLIGVAWASPVPGGMIGTQEYAASAERDAQLARVQDFLQQERVQAQLEALGVDADRAAERVESLTAQELAMLDGQIDEMAAGAGVLTVLGVLFVVMLVLELVGVTNIFVAI